MATDANPQTPANPRDLKQPFFDVDPPHWAARGLAYILLTLFVVVTAFAIFAKLPETVSSPFLLQPVRGTDPVRAPRNGVVAEVHVLEGQSIDKGEPLMLLRSAAAGDRAADLDSDRSELQGAEKRLAHAQAEHDSQMQANLQERRSDEERVAYLTQAISAKQKELQLTREVEKRYASALEQGIASWVEYTSHQLEANRVAIELQQLEAERGEHEASLKKLAHEAEGLEAKHKELKRSLDLDVEKLRIRIAALQDELGSGNRSEITVRAPCSGSVLSLAVRSAGAYVHDGDDLCEMACSGDRLQAELLLPQIGLGKIKPGQDVKLLYDAFPYQRYGIKYATLRWLSPSSVDVKGEPVFRALADLRDEDLLVDGKSRQLMAGMGGTARVVVGRRSLISSIFEPIQQLRENMAEAPRLTTPAVAGKAPASE